MGPVLPTELLTAVFSTGHLLIAAVWLGSMTYSLIVVQPRAARDLGPERYEQLAQSLAAGQRWKVLGLVSALAVSGAGLAVLVSGDAAWWILIAVHAVLLAVAVVVFARVSWRLWPQRLFALPGERGAVQAQFRRAALALLVVVTLACVLGAVAQVVRKS